jgi:hypothetical protein
MGSDASPRSWNDASSRSADPGWHNELVLIACPSHRLGEGGDQWPILRGHRRELCLAEYGPGFAAEIHRMGFAPLSAEHQVRLLAHLTR